MLRYKANLLSQSKKRKAGQADKFESLGSTKFLDGVEIQNAETEILKYVQEQSFKEERDLLNEIIEDKGKRPRKTQM